MIYALSDLKCCAITKIVVTENKIIISVVKKIIFDLNGKLVPTDSKHPHITDLHCERAVEYLLLKTGLVH